MARERERERGRGRGGEREREGEKGGRESQWTADKEGLMVKGFR